MQAFYEVVMSWTGGRDLDLKYRTTPSGPDIGSANPGAGNGVHSGDVIRACGGADAEERLTWASPGTRDDAVIVGVQAPGTDIQCAIRVNVNLYVYGERRTTGYRLDTRGDQTFSFNIVPPQAF